MTYGAPGCDIYATLLAKIEKNAIKGKITIDNGGDMGYTLYMIKKGNIMKRRLPLTHSLDLSLPLLSWSVTRHSRPFARSSRMAKPSRINGVGSPRSILDNMITSTANGKRSND